MHLIRAGFDGLDISYPLTIGPEVAETLENARRIAELEKCDSQVIHNGVRMLVAGSGAPGGYAFRGDSGYGGPDGEIWFFKRPGSLMDPWGVRVSCRAYGLATRGLAATRAKIEERLQKLGLEYVPGTESIGRVDVACDIVDPAFVLDRSHIVAPGQSRVMEISDSEVRVVGRSGRVESVTIGKNPNRQIIIYDKRAEVCAKYSHYWWPIWDELLTRKGLPTLDMRIRAKSAVWRVEVRAYKRHLSDKWEVKTWADLHAKLPDIVHTAMCDIRLTVPQADSNRARWPDHPMWLMAYEALTQDLSDLHIPVNAEVYKEVNLERRDKVLARQISGAIYARAALHGIKDDGLRDYVQRCASEVSRELWFMTDETKARIARARAKYSGVMLEGGA